MNFASRLLELVEQLQIPGRSHRRRRSGDHLEFQKLEPRTMLAGDVSVMISNINLVVSGDGADNQIQIIGTLNGGARVVGLNGTTINGGTDAFVSNLPGLRNAQINLNQGNDEVDILGARFNKGITLLGGSGNDMIMVRDSSIGSLNIQGGDGNDLIEIRDVFAINSSLINTSTGDDMIVIYNHASGGDISLQTGSGNDTIAIDRMGMHGRLMINTASGNDQVLMAGQTFVGRDSSLLLGGGDDFLAVIPGQNGGTSQLQRFTNVDGGGGNDNVALDASVRFQDSVNVDGNTGNDNFNNGGSNVGNASIRRFENNGFDLNAAMDQVFQQLTNEDIDPTIFGAPNSFILGISVDDRPLDFTEGMVAQRLDPTLSVTGAGSTTVTSATVVIKGFVANEDVLEFSNVGNVTGVFDDASGVLTFTGNGSLTDYQNALRTVAYRNSSETPNEIGRSLEVIVNTTDSTVMDMRQLNVFAVNDVPVLTVNQDPIGFDLDDTNLTRPAVLDSQLTLTDADTTELTGATVQIIGGGQGGDILGFVDANGITGNYNATTGLLTLTGTASVADYQTALRSVTFDNSNTRAPLGVRNIRFEVSDGQSTVAADVDVDVVASQTIDVATTATNLNYQETDPATVVDAGVVLNTGGDANATVNGATVSIVSGFDVDQDTLSFTAVSGITGSYDAANGVLTFSGDASAADYQTLLRSVTFVNSSFGDFDFSTADRVVEFNVERDSLTATASRTISVTEIATEQALIERFLEVNNLTSQMTASGLHFIVQQEGDGNFPDENSVVTVAYRGTLLNGNEFDSNQTGLTISLQSVIAGWTEGIPQFSTGGSGILLIPSDLGYGEAGFGNDIPPNSILFFEIELLSFTP